MQAAALKLQVPLSAGHFVEALAAVQATPVLLHPPVAGQLVEAFAAVQEAAVMLQLPLIVGQLALDVHDVPVCTEQLPMAGHCVPAFAGWHAIPDLLQVPFLSGQLALDVHTVPVSMLHLPAAAQPALLRQEVPVSVQLPGVVVQTVAAFADVQVAPLIVHLPAVVVVQVGGGQVVLREHVPHSGPTQVLQPGGSKAVVHEPGGGLTHVVVEVMLSQDCVLTLLQVCGLVAQVCVWNPLQVWPAIFAQVCV
ncbi:MAG: hypothetical protein ABI881_17460 [Betaproteobacteria bacterium]